MVTPNAVNPRGRKRPCRPRERRRRSSVLLKGLPECRVVGHSWRLQCRFDRSRGLKSEPTPKARLSGVFQELRKNLPRDDPFYNPEASYVIEKLVFPELGDLASLHRS